MIESRDFLDYVEVGRGCKRPVSLLSPFGSDRQIYVGARIPVVYVRRLSKTVLCIVIRLSLGYRWFM